MSVGSVEIGHSCVDQDMVSVLALPAITTMTVRLVPLSKMVPALGKSVMVNNAEWCMTLGKALLNVAVAFVFQTGGMAERVFVQTTLANFK